VGYGLLQVADRCTCGPWPPAGGGSMWEEPASCRFLPQKQRNFGAQVFTLVTKINGIWLGVIPLEG